ncbi:MAG: HepT-like ribonuclease domain-containing protein [Synergistota bacterium]|nr:HepT-like ribonuclease domain-containing protein [Synergistota bacterium]
MTLIAVGEEIKKVDRLTEGELFQLYPQIEWKGVMGLRDVLAHAYFDVDAEQVFSVCKERVPVLIEQIKEIIDDLEHLRI